GAILEGFFIDTGAAKTFYTAGFAFLGLVVFMSSGLASEFHARNMALEARERWLTRREKELSGIISSAMDAIISIDEAQRIRFFNPAAERVFGWSADKAINQDLNCLIPNLFRQAQGQQILELDRTNITGRTKAELDVIYGLRADGREFPIEASISQVETDGEKLYTAIVRDVTERYEAEKALRISEERFRT